ncbi:hypothetical protein LR48_Vigan03g087600 [Vigna angularis]|uniref:Uncharacterized protein n=1 Tax=Phaseolus angularis TaxID=3914 RepID=A0A0L9U532_PHAAN|nr:hypothetical protein LR48_Vigan03g087600 [Vigna angularis]
MKKAQNEEKLVHQESVHENNEPYLGKLVKFKNRLWVIKDIKDIGVIEIEGPYSRRVKMMRASTDGCCYEEEHLVMDATRLKHLLMDALMMKIQMRASTNGCY